MSQHSTVIKGGAGSRAVAVSEDVIGKFDPASVQMLRNPSGAVDSARQAGFDQGYADGLAQAHNDVVAATEDANKRVRRALAALSEAVEQFDQRQTVALVDVEDAIVAGALALARTILQRELVTATDPGGDALARALQLIPDRSDVVARMHPDDIATLNMDRIQTTKQSVALVADATIELGGCVVESGAMRIDAQLSTALHNACEVMGGDPHGTGVSEPLTDADIEAARHALAMEALERAAVAELEGVVEEVPAKKSKKASAGSSRTSSRKTAPGAPIK